jgi:hypothetical protein
MKAPLVKSYNGKHYFVVPVIGNDLCNSCCKLDDMDCTEHTAELPDHQQCGKAPVVYIRATAQGVANYMARRME